MSNKIKNINRRTVLIALMLMVVTVAVISCAKEESIEHNSSVGLIKVTGEDASTATKTILDGLETQWIGVDLAPLNADKVGIYSPQARGTSIGPDGVVNAQFTAQVSAKSSSFNGEMYWGIGEHKFYAYYPYNSEYYGTSTAVPISLSATQTSPLLTQGSTVDIGALDFLVATPVTIRQGSTGVPMSEINFKFNHLFSLLSISVTGSSGNLSAVRLSGPGILAFSGGIIDITQPTPAKGDAYTFANKSGISGTVIVTTSGTIGVGTYVLMMINPSEQVGKYDLGLCVDGSWKYISKDPPVGGFMRGNNYSVAVNTGVTTALDIGMDFGGGKIAYIFVLGDPGYDPNVQHGLIAATVDQSTSIQWWNGVETTMTGAYETTLGAGFSNTNKIIDSQGNSAIYAAKICRDYRGGGYTDWFLPSKGELNKLYLNRVAIGSFSNSIYWSSSEHDQAGAWLKDFESGLSNDDGKTMEFPVRAVRYF